jgi:hypothetical protein
MKHFNFLQSEIVLSCLGALSRLSHQVINIMQVSHFVFFYAIYLCLCDYTTSCNERREEQIKETANI